MRRMTAVLFLIMLLAAALCANAAGTEESLLREEFAARIGVLSELIDQALYLAVAGFSAYAADDQMYAAQGLVNLFEGPDGPNYDDALGEMTSEGMLSNPVLTHTAGWVELFQSLSGSDVVVIRDALANATAFLGLAYEMALAARDGEDGWFGAEFSFRIAYAFLVAARGSLDDPFLVAGINQLAALFPSSGVLASGVPDLQSELQSLIQSTPSGEAIHLAPGIHRGRIIVTQDLTITGTGTSPEETVLEGVAWDAVILVIADEPISVHLENLTIRGGQSGVSTWLPELPDGSVTLTMNNVHLVGNENGVSVGPATELLGTDCRFERNDVAILGLAKDTDELTRVDLTGCVLSENGRAVTSLGNQSIALYNCEILGGTGAGSDISIHGSGFLEMTGCRLQRIAGGGISLAGTASAMLINNVIETPYSHGVSIGPTSSNASTQDCGMFVSTDEEALPPGAVTGYGNTIPYGVCPVTIRFLTELAPNEVSVIPGQSIQAAIDVVADGGVITIGEGDYYENLDISKPLTLVGDGEVALIPVNQEIPAIRIVGSTDVVVQGIQIENAATGIEAAQASCQLVGCSFRTTDVAVRTIAFGSDVVLIQQCMFTGEEAGVGVATLGDGRIDIEDCEFLELGTGALLGGLTSVFITASTFEDCFDSIVLASSVAATLVGNHINGSLWHGIRVSSAPPGDYEDGSLVMNANTIQNSGGWDINLCDYPEADALTFTGRLSGIGNILAGDRDLLCPVDYNWPEGFFADE